MGWRYVVSQWKISIIPWLQLWYIIWAFCWAGLRPTQLHSCFCHFIQSTDNNQENIEVDISFQCFTRHCSTSRRTQTRCARPAGSQGRSRWSPTPREAKSTSRPSRLPVIEKLCYSIMVPVKCPSGRSLWSFAELAFWHAFVPWTECASPCAVVHPDWVLFFATSFNFSPDE